MVNPESRAVGLLVLATLGGCSGTSTTTLSQTVEFKLLVPVTTTGIDLVIRLPADTRFDGGDLHSRDWGSKPLAVSVTADQQHITATFEQPCAGPVVPPRGSVVVTSRRESTRGTLWSCEIRGEMGAPERVWVERLVRNVSELIECHVELGASPSDENRDTAIAVCESLTVRGRSEFTRADRMGSDIVRRDTK